jgi:predicted MarR family transcription regulator
MDFSTSVGVCVTNVSRDSVYSLTLRKILELGTLTMAYDGVGITFSITNGAGHNASASYLTLDLDEMSLVSAYAGLSAQLEVERYKREQKLQSSSFVLPGPSGELKLGL